MHNREITSQLERISEGFSGRQSSRAEAFGLIN